MAAASPMASAIGGVPASNFHGMSLGVHPSRRTSRIISPPPRNAGMASSSSARAHSTPMPVGPSILWPVKPKKSQSMAATSVGRWGTYWAASTQDQRAGGVGGVGEPPDRGERAEHVRHRRDADELHAVDQPVEVGEVERVVVGHRDERSSMPRSSRSISHGTRLAWCSISVSRMASPSCEVGPAPGVGDEVDRLGDVLGEDDLAGTAAPMKRATASRASS